MTGFVTITAEVERVVLNTLAKARGFAADVCAFGERDGIALGQADPLRIQIRAKC
jgi:hypothetical protein